MLVNDFLITLEIEKGYSPKTIREYSYDLKMFERFNGKPLEKTTTMDLRRFLLYLKRDKEYAARSLHRKICSLKSFFKFLKKEGLISTNPTENIESPKIPKSLPKTITIEETMKLLATPDNLRDKAILYLLYGTGMRVSELSNLNIEQIDLKDKIIHVVGGKGGKDRIIPLPNGIIKILEDYIITRGSTQDSAFILNRSGNRLTSRSIQRIVKKYKNAANLLDKTLTPHTLRHAFATHLLSNAVDIRVIQELLGHASLSTTQLYTHVSLEHLRKSYDLGHPLSKQQVIEG
ncbi:MAG: tyrosine recombinase XerC [Candidatus Heimdallarchaeota archaeon]|nr:MAG: tyrosine recombinase XerC [Candidatus Heimdallarchaeota archaeon]